MQAELFTGSHFKNAWLLKIALTYSKEGERSQACSEAALKVNTCESFLYSLSLAAYYISLDKSLL